jgi:hypothetical protein
MRHSFADTNRGAADRKACGGGRQCGGNSAFCRVASAAAPVYSEAMAPRRNPLGLNPLQLKTLTLLQELARLAGQPAGEAEADGIAITRLPNPHGDHFHLGEAVVAARDATGLRNPAVWAALHRKGLILPKLPEAVILTPAGQQYDTGLRDRILQRAEH